MLFNAFVSVFRMILAKQFVQKPKNPSYGEDFKAIFSPIFLNTDFDSKDGKQFGLVVSYAFLEKIHKAIELFLFLFQELVSLYQLWT